ncbi:hypothetical protein AUP68_10895 [Ilyonectria robusta]
MAQKIDIIYRPKTLVDKSSSTVSDLLPFRNLVDKLAGIRPPGSNSGPPDKHCGNS